jgi:hypothetical protein
MKKFLSQLVMVAIGITATLSAMDILYTWAISETKLYGIGKNEHIDYLIAGDSRTNPLLPQYLCAITGKKVINIGEPGYVLDDNIKVLEYFFKRGNRAERVLLQVDWKFGSRKPEDVTPKEWRYMPNLIREEGLLTPRVPFKLYAENNRNIKIGNVYRFMKTAVTGYDPNARLDTMSVLRSHRPFLTNEKLRDDYSTMKFRIEDINALNAYLKKNGVKELILFSPPYLPEWISTQSDSASFKQIIRSAGYKYHDLSTVYRDTTYFKDYLHVRNSKYLEFCRLFASVTMQESTLSLK